ncbi:MAG: hypothetical protein WA061_03035 [Microgenomates group bacterium]
MSKSVIKFYVIPGLVALFFIIILLLVPLNNKKEKIDTSPTPNTVITLPTKFLAPDKTTSPTLIPPQKFTGADINQELPSDLKEIGEQKTALRRLTPLTLPFGVIEFDYGNDMFIVRFNESSDQNLQLFSTWREENYPALTQDKFAF